MVKGWALPVATGELGLTLVIAGTTVGLFTSSAKVFDAVCDGVLASRTVTATLKVPAAFGVRKRAPVVAFIDIPLGSPVAVQLYGVVPPVAATACCAAYATPTVAVAGFNAVVVIVSAATAIGVG